MQEQVRLNGKWYDLMEIGKEHLTICIGKTRVGLCLVSKREVQGYRLV
jgi:hypothetical protein